MDLQHYIDHPDEELSFDAVEAIGLDGTGRTADHRFPCTWANLTADERDQLRAHATNDPGTWTNLSRNEINR